MHRLIMWIYIGIKIVYVRTQRENMILSPSYANLYRRMTKYACTSYSHLI